MRNLTLNQKQFSSLPRPQFQPNSFRSFVSITKLEILFSLNRHLLGSLFLLTSLQKLIIFAEKKTNQEEFENIFGKNLQKIEKLSNLVSMKLGKLKYLNCNEIQKRFSSIRFRWLFHRKTKDPQILDYFSQVHYVLYEGAFSISNFPEGHGIMKFPNGNRYEGNFINGRMEGFGKYFFNNGTIYEGNFDGLRHGFGKLFSFNGNRYEGNFAKGEKHGFGICFYHNGDRYEGNFVHGKKEGFGKFFSNRGTRSEGNFVNGKLEGEGKSFYSNGQRYEGHFENSLPEGFGVLFYPDGTRIEGNFTRDQWKADLTDR